MTIQRFRPRVAVEAVQWPESVGDSYAYACRAAEIHRWVNENGGTTRVMDDDGDVYTAIVDDCSGQRIELGDWIVRGTTGVFFVVKPDDFAENYELEES